MSIKRVVSELLKMPEEEMRTLAVKQLKWGRKILERERTKRGVRSIQQDRKDSC